MDAVDGVVVEVDGVESTSGKSESEDARERVEIDSRVGGVGMTASYEHRVNRRKKDVEYQVRS